MSRFLAFALFLAAPIAAADPTTEARDALWAAVRSGDATKVAAQLDKNGDVNARNETGITALWIAAANGHKGVIELLIARGADVNARDGIWYQTPLSQSTSRAEIAKLLLKAGAKDGHAALIAAAQRGNAGVVKAVLDAGKPRQEVLDAALFSAALNTEVKDALTAAGAKPVGPTAEKDREAWKPLAGTYESDNGGQITVELREPGLVARRGGLQLLRPTGTADAFTVLGSDAARVCFDRAAGRVVFSQYTSELTFYRVETKPIPKPTGAALAGGRVVEPANWPAFRGLNASGVADGQDPPVTWDVKTGANVRWKTPIPGLGHSCPVVWGDKVFLTTAVGGNTSLKTGNYGDPGSVPDTSKHSWQLLCLDRETGKVLWTKTAFEGVPKIKRHLKGSQANCTPVTDGKRVVVCFGSEGLYCYDFQGTQLWKRDLGAIDSSFALEREYEWGFASSPVLHDGLVILQGDLSRDSFLAAYRLDDGSRVWSTPRDEIPSWSSPMVWANAKRTEIVTNASQYARGYDPATGKELWRLAKKSEATVPTPVGNRDLVFVMSGNRPIQPVIAVRAGATGDISLKPGEERNEFVAWGKLRGGPYMPSPVLYGPHLYTCGNAGMVTCYDAATGKEVYKERLGGTSYTASPVAADGRLYFASEQGEVRVVKAGPGFELLAVNPLGESVMASPAVSGGVLYVRGQHHLFALGK